MPVKMFWNPLMSLVIYFQICLGVDLEISNIGFFLVKLLVGIGLKKF